jgi:hypothetical protein
VKTSSPSTISLTVLAAAQEDGIAYTSAIASFPFHESSFPFPFLDFLNLLCTLPPASPGPLRIFSFKNSDFGAKKEKIVAAFLLSVPTRNPRHLSNLILVENL